MIAMITLKSNLILDPSPTINKADFMILRVKKQREIHMGWSDIIEDNAIMNRAYESKKDLNGKIWNKEKK